MCVLISSKQVIILIEIKIAGMLQEQYRDSKIRVRGSEIRVNMLWRTEGQVTTWVGQCSDPLHHSRDTITLILLYDNSDNINVLITTYEYDSIVIPPYCMLHDATETGGVQSEWFPIEKIEKSRVWSSVSVTP